MNMPQELHSRISKSWKGKIYQSYGNILERFALASSYMNIFKDKNVLEIGCNAGISMWYIMQHASSYTGLEPHPVYYNQAVVTRKFLPHVLKIELYDERLINFRNNTFDAFFGANILYWLTDQEITILQTHILPKCNSIMILTRSKERSVQKNSYYLNRKYSVLKLFKDIGFTVDIIDIPVRKINGKITGGYFLTVGTK